MKKLWTYRGPRTQTAIRFAEVRGSDLEYMQTMQKCICKRTPCTQKYTPILSWSLYIRLRRPWQIIFPRAEVPAGNLHPSNVLLNKVSR